MRRLIQAVLVVLSLVAVSGIMPIAGVEPCEEGCEGEGGCPPLCTDCVCPSYFAPGVAPAPEAAVRFGVTVVLLEAGDRIPAERPPPDVFHPPRISA